MAHDCGTMINPMIVEGQVQGGVAHGIGNALSSGCIYDDDGQPLTPLFAEYLLPAARDVPFEQTSHGIAVAAQPARGQGRGRRRHHPGAAAIARRSRTRWRPTT